MKHQINRYRVWLEPAVFERFVIENDVYICLPIDIPDNIYHSKLQIVYNSEKSACQECAFHCTHGPCSHLVCQQEKRSDRVAVIFKKVLDNGVLDD